MQNINITLPLGQSKTVTLVPNAPLPAGQQPNWSRLSGTASVDVATDGMSAVVTASGSDTGRTIFAVSATAGRDIVGFILGISVVHNETESLNPVVS